MRRLDAIIVGVVIFGTVVTAVAGWFSYRSYRLDEVQKTALKADNAASAAKLALDRVGLSVRAVKAMYAASWVTRDTFVRFARTLMTSEGIRTLEFDRKVQQKDRAVYQQTLSSGPGKTLGIWQYGKDGKPESAPDRPVYFVDDAAVFQDGTPPAFGLDVASDAPRAAVIQNSIATFDLVVSPPVDVGDAETKGVWLVIPVVDRTGEILGVAAGAIAFDQLAAVAERASGASGVDITLAPLTAPADKQKSAGPTPSNQRTFAFGGRTWTLTVPMRDSGDPIGAWLVVLVVGAGLATTAAVAAYLAGLGKTTEIAQARSQLLRMLDGLGPLAWLLDADGTVVHANSAAGAALAKHEDHIVGRPLWRLPLPADGGSIERIKAAIRRASLGEDSRFDLTLTDEDDGTRVFDLWIRPLKDTAAAPTNIVASAVDITDRHEAEQTQRMLMRELDHRMKNTLQVIQAIIRRTAKAQTSVAMFEHALLGRIETMSRAHELLAEERWLGAEMKAVITQEVDSFDASGAIRVDGPRLRLNPRGALSIALAVHELGTNASKYGALSSPEGHVSVTWRVDKAANEPTVVLHWRESAGPPVSPPKSRGFGSMLIERSIAYELEGRTHLDYRRDGLVCTISIPIRMLRSFINERPLEYVH